LASGTRRHAIGTYVRRPLMTVSSLVPWFSFISLKMSITIEEGRSINPGVLGCMTLLNIRHYTLVILIIVLYIKQYCCALYTICDIQKGRIKYSFVSLLCIIDPIAALHLNIVLNCSVVLQYIHYFLIQPKPFGLYAASKNYGGSYDASKNYLSCILVLFSAVVCCGNNSSQFVP
jgi:hypothetical protein